ncbi:MAG: pyridoxal phosphate-dependent decarboxylase family protein, partial [Balneolaceae bacterium]
GQAHHSLDKAYNIAGLKEAVIRTIPMDDSFRMQPEALARQIETDKRDGLRPFLLVASAGTTDTGAIDPMQPLADIAKQHRLWFHVDAAYGGAFLLTEYGKNLMAGIERADSVIIDPHKGFFLPYGTGALLVRDKKKLYESQHMTAGYMQDTLKADELYSPADLSPELSRHFRGLRMWLPLKLYGIGPFRSALEEKRLLTEYFYRQIQQIDGIETGPKPELSVTIFRYCPDRGDADDFNRKLAECIHKDGRIFLSSTTIEGTVWLRMAIVGLRTHLKEVEEAIGIIREKIEDVET